MPKSTTYRCVDCKRIRKGSPGTRWCDECGGELKPIRYGTRKRSTRDRN